MPAFKKRALSLYLRNKCERQFALYLYTDKERKQYSMPTRHQRAGLGIVGQAGFKWQDEKIRELSDVFGKDLVVENPHGTATRPGTLALKDTLPTVRPYQFIVEGSYEADTLTFRQTIGLIRLTDFYGHEVEIGSTRPDIIQVFPSAELGGAPTTSLEPDPYSLAVEANGNLVPLSANDTRMRLRVIDIKLTSEPGAHYFAEVVYYSMTLAAWLEEAGLSDRFVVIGAPAVWPGSHEASKLSEKLRLWRQRAYEPSHEELAIALEDDLETATFDVFAPRLRTLLSEELPRMLSKRWDELSWHVDYRCKGCEFLSPNLDNEHEDDNAKLRCYLTAEREQNLSRINGLTKGASEQLRQQNVINIEQLADTDSKSLVFDAHHGLKTKRASHPYRAQALLKGTTSVIPNSGGDALMPKFPALRIYIYLDYDLSSALTTSMAIRANWRENLPYNSLLESQTRSWTLRSGEDEVFLVDTPKIERERAEFLKFLGQLARILDEVRNQDAIDYQANRRNDKTRRSTYQIYLWDESQKKHLIRLISRHLPYVLADASLSELVWLFPPPEMLQDANEATRSSAITLVKTVVENTVAIDIPHYYSLLDLARRVTPNDFAKPSVHPLYEEQFSDLIPMERLHEYWQRSGQWTTTQERIMQATRSKVIGLQYVASWLARQLADVLSNLAAPPLLTPSPRRVGRISPVSRLWLGFTKLNASLEALDKDTIRAMPPHEKIARFRSARLTMRLEGNDKYAAIELLNQSDAVQLTTGPGLFVYTIDEDSVDININRGEFLYALAPEDKHGFLDLNAFSSVSGSGLESNKHYNQTVETAGFTSVTVEAIDRVKRLIALRVDDAAFIAFWERNQVFDFSRNVILDPIHRDFLTKKVELTLQGIGYPPSATADQRVIDALGLLNARIGRSAETPASEILWNAAQLSSQESIANVIELRREIGSYFSQQRLSLNDSQWVAWEEAFRKKLSLVWGPPGTGKSRTLRAIVLGATFHAKANNIPLRLLISANTYTAIDNILLDLEGELRGMIDEKDYSLYRVQSKWRESPPANWKEKYPTLRNLVVNRHSPTREVNQLRDSLQNPKSIIIVGCPPQQLHNLATVSIQNVKGSDTIKQWFDFIVIDEASQIDVATSTLIFSKRTANGACVIAGDDKQLPPIHQADPPKELDYLVGSLYNFFRHYHKIDPNSLDVNYRSNSTIVEFIKTAGYTTNLGSFSPNLKLDFVEAIREVQPDNWPQELFWSPLWWQILDPDYPAVSFVYDDVLSSQVNEFEAHSVAAMIWLLRNYLKPQLADEVKLDRTNEGISVPPIAAERFWQQSVGVVTPHRAQRAKVLNQLRNLFQDDPLEKIVSAVDTVERYQGQQRDVIIASFGIGDPDLIRSEDEFLYNLNRFNVLVSRARAKAIVLCTMPLLQHLSNDVKVLEESRLLKGYTETFCQNPQQIRLGFYRNNEFHQRHGILRKRVV